MTVAGVSRVLVLMLFVLGTFFGGATLLRSSAQGCGGPIWTVPTGNYPANPEGIVDTPLSFSIYFPGCAGTAYVYWTLTDITTQTVVQSNAQVTGGSGSGFGYGFPYPLYVGSYEFLGQYTFVSLEGSTTSGLWPGFFTVGPVSTTTTNTMMMPSFTFYVDSPVNILVTDPNGQQAGFEADGSPVTPTINGAVVVGPCSNLQSNEQVFVTIPNPIAGQYKITAYPSCATSGGSPYTIDVQQGTTGTFQNFSGTAYQGGAPQNFYISLTSTIPTPEFPIGVVSMLFVALVALFSFGVVSRRRKLHKIDGKRE
jgi:hypothetical protein